MSLVVLQRIFSEDVMLRHRLQVSLFLALVGHLLLLAVFAVAVGQSFQPISMQQEMVVTLQTEPAEQALIEPVEEPMSYLTSDQSPGHCANIMRAQFSDMGSDLYNAFGSQYPTYWTAAFGRKSLF